MRVGKVTTPFEDIWCLLPLFPSPPSPREVVALYGYSPYVSFRSFCHLISPLIPLPPILYLKFLLLLFLQQGQDLRDLLCLPQYPCLGRAHPAWSPKLKLPCLPQKILSASAWILTCSNQYPMSTSLSLLLVNSTLDPVFGGHSSENCFVVLSSPLPCCLEGLCGRVCP